MFALVGVVAAGQVVATNVIWAAVAGEPDDVLKVLIAQLLIACGAIAITAVAIKARRGWALRARLPSRDALREITSFGAKTSSGQAGLGMLLAADKPVLGSVMAVSAIPAYSIPFALALRIMLVSSSVSSAVFPPAVAALAAGDRSELARLRAGAPSRWWGSSAACWPSTWCSASGHCWSSPSVILSPRTAGLRSPSSAPGSACSPADRSATSCSMPAAGPERRRP